MINRSGTPIDGDYIAFHTAGRLVLSGHAEQIYDKPALFAVQDLLLGGRSPGFYDAYRNPPFFGLIFAPLATLDLLPGLVVRSLLSLACLTVALWLVVSEMPWLQAPWSGRASVCLTFLPVDFGAFTV